MAGGVNGPSRGEAFVIASERPEQTDAERERCAEIARASRAGHARPWRKPVASVQAERAAARRELGDGGVDLAALLHALEAQEMIASAGDAAHLQPAVTALLQAATNARPRTEVDEATAVLAAAMQSSRLRATGEASALPTKASAPARGSATARLAVMHKVIPRLFVGGWTALLNGTSARSGPRRARPPEALRR